MRRAKLQDSGLTPSAQTLAALDEQDISFFEFAMRQSIAHQAYFQQAPLAADKIKYFERLAQESLEQQQSIETSDKQTFAEYLAAYLAQ